MSKCFLLILLSFSFFLSCKKGKQTAINEIKKSERNIVVSHKISSVVSPSSLKKIESWKEYTAFNDFIKRYEKTSPDEAFDNISELKDLTIALEDSLNITLFKNPAFKSRLHVLENEIMRLDDMEGIPVITPKEVNYQIDKILLVFSSLNNKINTVFNQEKFEKGLDTIEFFTMDKAELLEPKKNLSKKDLTKLPSKPSKKPTALKRR